MVDDDRATDRRSHVEGSLWLLLGSFVVLSRALAAPDILAEWDSANYALAVVDFDVYEHRPHSPGYPLFVAMLWLSSAIPGPPHLPFLVVNTLLSLGILGLLGFVVRMETGRATALALAAAMTVCPVFWYHGALSTAYVAECFASVLVGTAAWALATGRLGSRGAAVALVVASGLRPNSLLYLLPLLGFSMLWSKQGLRSWLSFVVVSSVGILCWAVPTVVLSGGWERYWTTTRALARWQSSTTSVLSGSFGEASYNLESLLLYLGDALNGFVLLLVLCLALVVAQRRFRLFWPLFLTTWCLPPALLYTLHHLPKAGYILTILPGGFLATALAYGTATAGWSIFWRRCAAVLCGAWVALVVAANAAAFYLAVPVSAVRSDGEELDEEYAVLLTGDYGLGGIHWRTEPQRRLRALMDELGGADSAVVFLWRTHQLQRIESVYHPQQWVFTEALAHDCIQSNRDSSEAFCGSFGDMQIRVLEAPEGGLHSELETRLDLVDNSLIVRRSDYERIVPLEPLPSTLLVVAPCPPCSVDVGSGLAHSQAIPMTDRFKLIVLDVVGADHAEHPLGGGPL